MILNINLSSPQSTLSKYSGYLFFFVLFAIVIFGASRQVGFKNAFNSWFNYKFLTGYVGFPEVVRPGEELEATKFLLKSDNKIFKQKELDKLSILLPPKSFKQIQKDRKKFIKNKGNTKKAKKVKASLIYKGRELSSKVKLKGLYGDHWIEPERYSLNIELKNGGNLLGISRFAVQKPSTRNYGVDYAMSRFIRGYDILSPEHFFLKTSLNGFNWGLMNVEEKLDKYFLENKKRKESLIFQLESDEIFTSDIRKKAIIKKKAKFKNFLSSKINFSEFRVVNKVDHLKNPVFNKYYNYYSKLFKLDLINKENIGNFFDFESYSKAFLLVSATGNCHGLLAINRYEYLSPYTLKLEVITTDNSTVGDLEKTNAFRWCKQKYPYSILFQNKDFVEIIKKNLNIFDDVKQVEKINQDLGKYINYRVNNLADSFPLYGSSKKFKGFDADLLKSNINFLKKSKDSLGLITAKKSPSNDDKVDPKVYESYLNLTKSKSSLIDAYVNSDKNLVIKNLTNTTIELDSIGTAKKTLVENKILEPSKIYEVKKIVFDSFKEIKVKYSVGKHKYTKKVNNYFTKALFNPLLKYKVPKFLIKKANGYVIKEGSYQVNSPIVVPSGKSLTIEAGTNLVFDQNAYIIVNGSLSSLGTKDKPVRLEPKDKFWKGIYVHNSFEKSYINHTKISSLKNLHDGILNLTGAVSFYKSDVEIKYLEIKDVKGEDGLNVISSKIKIDNLKITKTKSDAFDGDFIKGEIKNSYFAKIKGDAIDISGSDLKVSDVVIKNVKDKALSVGEESTLKGKNLTIEKIGTGVAVKDGSSAKISKSSISESSFLDAATYIKKENYLSKTELSIKGLKECIPKKLLRERNTRLECNKDKIKSVDVDVDTLYDTVMKK